MSKKRLLILLGILLVSGLTVREWTLLPDGHTHLYFFDVGQGDGALIVTPSGKQIVIDGGPDWKVLEGLGKTMPFLDRSIDLLVLSHANSDHSIGLAEILRRYDVGVLIVSGIEQGAAREREILETAKLMHVSIRAVRAGDRIDLSDGTFFDVLWPPRTLAHTFVTDLNNAAVLLKLHDGDHTALFTGDMEKVVEDVLVKARADVSTEILKVAHHGSKTSSSEEFLGASHPKTAVISVGTKNTYGHPNSGVLERLQSIGATVRRTDLEGAIEIEWGSQK